MPTAFCHYNNLIPLFHTFYYQSDKHNLRKQVIFLMLSIDWTFPLNFRPPIPTHIPSGCLMDNSKVHTPNSELLTVSSLQNCIGQWNLHPSSSSGQEPWSQASWLSLSQTTSWFISKFYHFYLQNNLKFNNSLHRTATSLLQATSCLCYTSFTQVSVSAFAPISCGT